MWLALQVIRLRELEICIMAQENNPVGGWGAILHSFFFVPDLYSHLPDGAVKKKI